MANNQNKKYTILIIEDNEINCEILNEILQDQYNLLFAYNGKEGMDMLHTHYGEIEIVLLDIQMPIMNGYEVLKAKSKEPLLRDIPVIVTTSSNGNDEEVKCLELGAQDFVGKPYEPLVVRLRIGNIINLRKSTEANQQKAAFIHIISHEIRTPLNAIMGFSQLLESMADSMSVDELKMFCSNITKSSHALLDMITNTVNLSDYDNGYMTVNLTDISPNQICKEAIEKASYCAPESVNVRFTSDVDDSFSFKSDEKYLEVAIYNYIINANKFTKQGDIHIHCSAKDKPGTMCFYVTDTGIGVPKDKAEYIFERYTKVDEFVRGLGLGLAITKNIATSLNGSAYLDTNYTAGARFILEVPVRK